MSKLRNEHQREDSNPGSLDYESGILPLSYRASHALHNDHSRDTSCWSVS